MKVALCIEYDGSKFFGWQIQKGSPTVQGAVERALSSVADEKVKVICAGRTDRGVHACGQIAHFQTNRQRSAYSWMMGANTALPEGISVLWAHPVNESFHARFSAQSRSYRYVMLNRKVRPAYLARRVSWFHQSLNEAAMSKASDHLLGKHDFSAFRSSHCSSKDPIKKVEHIAIRRKGDWIWLDIRADGFLHHMVRNIVGTLLLVGRGEQDTKWVREVLLAKDRTRAGVTAPPDGLYFVKVKYPREFGLPKTPGACRYW